MIATATDAHPAIAVMDCSFIAKSGQRTDGLDLFYNGSYSRVEQGLEVSLLAVVDSVPKPVMPSAPRKPQPDLTFPN